MRTVSTDLSILPLAPPTWAEIFGNTKPVEVEIGPGKGSFLMDLARNTPERNFFGVEFSARRAFRIARLLERDGPSNAIVIRADFGCLVRTFIHPESVAVYHWYFPDPWWKTRHHKRRLIQNDFPRAVTRTLVPGGKLLFASDVKNYFDDIVEQLNALPELTQFSWQRDQVTHRGRVIITDFERKYIKQGRPIYYAGFQKNTEQEAGLTLPNSSPSRRSAGH